MPHAPAVPSAPPPAEVTGDLIDFSDSSDLIDLSDPPVIPVEELLPELPDVPRFVEGDGDDDPPVIPAGKLSPELPDIPRAVEGDKDGDEDAASENKAADAESDKDGPPAILAEELSPEFPDVPRLIEGDEDGDEDAASEKEAADAESDRDDQEEGVKRWVTNEAPKPRRISEKKRAENAAFALWVEQNQQNLTKTANKIVLDGEQSAGWLVKDSGNKKVITSPRDYQLELFELAKTQNTIAVLDTGSGKTLIAALLLQWTLQNELEDRAQELPKRIAFFLVDKVALVFQQHAFLTCNLDYPVEKLCGEIVDSISSAGFWQETLDNYMAVVCTADILYRCLNHSFLRMEQINLLVFDEAHHTKKNHPFARIIKDHYAPILDVAKRPRILGMTASPVDAQVDPKRAAAELEALLHSRISTVSNPDVLIQTICKPKSELVVEYESLPRDFETELHRSLKVLVGDHELFQKPCAFSKMAAAELGAWVSDRYWQLFFMDTYGMKLEAKTERNLLREYSANQTVDRHVKQVQDARNLVFTHEFQRPALSEHLLSSKAITLHRTLQDQFNDGDVHQRCIVFVKQRNTASMLSDLLQQSEMQIPGVRVGILTGGGTYASCKSQNFSFRTQVQTIRKFKNGDINCLFATSVAEEGLDIPDCNVIIRFDLYDTLIQYIQSRGRARQADSQYIHMVEKGNMMHRKKVYQNKANELVIRQFCVAMPEDRKLTGNNFDMEYFLRKEQNQRQYIVPETGAKLSYKQSLTCLSAFVSSLPHPPSSALYPEYVITSAFRGFQCEVMLPPESPIRSAIGNVYASKAVAKCSAAFEMCLALIRGKYLDSHLRPIFTKQLPAMRNARLAISSKKRAQYEMRVKPEIWSVLGNPVELFAMALTLADPKALGRASTPLLLLTRQPIPPTPMFPLFFGSNRASNVCCTPVPESFKLKDDKLVQALTSFTLKIFADIFSKEYEASAAELPYYLAPTLKGHAFDFSSVTDVSSIVDWTAMEFVQANERIKYDFNEPDEFFQNKYVADPWDGSRKFFVIRRRHDFKPTDLVPEGVVAPAHRAWRRATHSIINYSNSLGSRSRSCVTFREDQPVVEAELLPIRRDLLDEASVDHDPAANRCFLVLEPMRISPISVDVVAMVYNFPAIIHRIDSNLVALDACRMLGLRIRPDLALEALTKDSDNTNEHGAEKIHFQGGMGKNYERLEFLGDAFLKMATSISIFTLMPDTSEYVYHVKRMLLLCNRNLFNNGLEVNLEQYIRSVSFNRRRWYPEGLTLKKGKRSESKPQHTLGDKTIADVCEALIGAAYLTGMETDSFDLAIQAVTTVVKDKNHAMLTWNDYYEAYKKPEWQTMPETSTQIDMARRFHRRLGYAFKYPRLLRSAFQHPTYPQVYEKLPSYQRLEWLGDALLDMACIDFLFHRFPDADPQWLTEHKMAMVSNQFLGCLAVMLQFNKAIMFSSPVIQKRLAEYVAEINDALQTAKEEAVGAGKSESEYLRNFWVECLRPPKCLPDVLEAYIGAIFVDSHYDYSTVQLFFREHVQPFFEDMSLYDTFANKHPVNFLAKLMQTRLYCTSWRVLVKELKGDDIDGGAAAAEPLVVCGVRVHEQTIAHTVGVSSRYAKISAAEKAMEILEKMTRQEFKRTYSCQCVVNEDEKIEAGQHGSAV
ncbi:hypothetical protein B0T26DRAFT_646598 [Lasiosphaeria miniovina]|uniref:Dicer-like protein 1 n=1 Tax=Lasiosphaeria miniovina TaxID=1954250 RepID=A0AA40DZ71_9PEZI|nr:uncharacterized protein B0T26DRAFT_646598 [Lasiosphaeria miniovina]KAK0718311.1 hypothetical protein B0T26DRAFT_646598 [Lasiosphaeria miniovina]